MILLAGLFLSFSALAQETGEIRGIVYDEETGEPIIFTNVYLEEITKGATTDVNGFYSITKIPPGQYTLIATQLGYDTARVQVDVQRGELISQNLYIAPGAVELDAVEISSESGEKLEEARVSVQKVNPLDIKKLPSVGAEPDLAQYLQLLPGVVFTGDQGGQLYIRGGAPIQNKVLLDGMTIYNPFHSIGFFSVFDVDIIRNIDVFTGGFNAQYGGRVSAIVDVTTRDGNKRDFSGKVSASPFVAKVLLEGPLKKFEEGESSSSLLFSGRGSYLRQTSPVVYEYASEEGLPYNFLDLYGKYSWSAPGGSQVDLFGFNFRDNVTLSSIDYSWNSFGGGTKFLLVPGSSSTVIDGNLAWSSYEMEQLQPDLQPRYSSISGFQSGFNFSYFPGRNLLRYGFDISGFKTDFQVYNAANRRIGQTDFTTELGGYIRYKVVTDRLVLDPSFRVQYYASLQEISPEPRLSAKFNVTDNFRLKMATGIFSQNLLSATSDRDVVNLFYGFLTGPDNLPTGIEGEDVTSRLQKARHLIGGVEFDLWGNHEFNVEGYIKDFNQLLSVNRNKIFDDTREFQNEPYYLRENFIVEEGKAYGFDVSYKYERQQWYIWFVYSYGEVTRKDAIQEYNPHWDRRHTVNALVSRSFGPDNSWDASIRWTLGSGFPFTLTQGFYEFIDFDEGLSTDYTSANGNLGIIYGDLNTGRLPYFHRMDVSLSKEWRFSKRSALQAKLSIVNTYNRDNIFYFNRVLHERVNQLPILPSIGVSYTW